VREKVTKERTNARSEIAAGSRIERYGFGAAIGAHSSGGIAAQYAKKWFGRNPICGCDRVCRGQSGYEWIALRLFFFFEKMLTFQQYSLCGT
jgi:hypothetical protein